MKAARVFALVLILSSPFVMVVFAQSSSGSLYMNVTGSKADTKCIAACLSTLVFTSGSFTASGGYVGPVYLVGKATVLITSTNVVGQITTRTVGWSWTDGFTVGGKTIPSNGGFSRNGTATNQLSFYSEHLTAGITWTVEGYSGNISAYSDPGHTTPIPGYGGVFGGGTFGSNPTYLLAIQLPLINDSMLGATVNAKDAAGNPNPVVPVSGIYNFIMVIALIIIAAGAAILLFTGLGGREKEKGGGMSQVLMQVATAVIVILIFPIVYNQVAQLINYMSQTIIAYPNPPQFFNTAIQGLWNAATAGSGVSWTSIITLGIPTMAVWIMELIATLMVYFLGIVRILLIAVMITAFPLAVALKLIPFTSKLSQMIEDTLFGLMLAAIMSAVIAGVAGQIINNYSGGFFALAIGPSSSNWVAIAAIFAIILMPTVFAPLTATMMQTVSQTAMMAGGVATAIGAGVGGPAAGGAVAGGKAASGAMSAAASSGAGLGSQLATGLSAFAGTFKSHAAMPMLQNAAIVGTTGVAAALGGSQASRVMRGAMPPISGPGVVMKSYDLARQGQEANQLVAQHDQAINIIFSTAGSVSPQLQGEMKQALGNSYIDATTPEGRASASQWYTKMKNFSDPQVINVLSSHGSIDGAKYKSNPMYKEAIDGRIQEWKQRLNELDPEVNEANYQKVADLKNQLNYGFHKGNES